MDFDSEINNDEIWKIFHLYENSEYLKHKIIAKDALCEEYYLINFDWINQFREIFHYNSIVNLYKKNYKDKKGLRKEDIKISNLPKVSRKNRENIKIIKNESIILNNLEESISYFYFPFCLIHPKYYDIITEGYNIDERIKCDIYLVNRTFVIDLSDKIIEVGMFDTTYTYKVICLLKFEKDVNYKDEIKQIFEMNLFGYFYNNNITENKLIQYPNLSSEKFHLIRIYIDPKVINKNNKVSIPQISNDLDISYKLGLYNFDSPESSKLNSIIQILTSIKEIYELFLNEDIVNQIKTFNHVYVFSSFFLEAFKYVYKENTENQNILKQMNVIINFFDDDISKKDIIDYLNFILQLLHNELLFIPDNLKQEKIIFSSPLSGRNESFNNFIFYYQNNYKKSIISNLFNWLKEKKVDCSLDNTCLYSSFQCLPLIEFDFNLLYRNQNQNLTIDLINCFIEYQKISIDDNPNLPQCIYCNSIHPSKYFICNTPPYFIIGLNRKNKTDIKVKYNSYLDITTCVGNDSKYKVYKLTGVIMEEGNNYYSVIKSTNMENYRDYEIWIKFKGENATKIFLNQKSPFENKNAYNEVYNPINSRILFFKGIK